MVISLPIRHFTDEPTMPSRIESIRFWKEILEGNIAEYAWIGPKLRVAGWKWGDSYDKFMAAQENLYHLGECGFCGDMGTKIDQYGYYYCLCWLLKDAHTNLEIKVRDWGSKFYPHTLDTLNTPTGSSGQRGEDVKLFKQAVQRSKDWMRIPDKWLVFSGPTGTGKTHVLCSIMSQWYPYSIYVTGTDFEQRLRSYLNSEIDLISQYMNALMWHPILIFDDLGIEYASKWILAKLDGLIEYRSRDVNWWDKPTLIGTNIRRSDMRQYFVRDGGVSRGGSRLNDGEIVEWLIMKTTDYREQK